MGWGGNGRSQIYAIPYCSSSAVPGRLRSRHWPACIFPVPAHGDMSKRQENRVSFENTGSKDRSARVNCFHQQLLHTENCKIWQNSLQNQWQRHLSRAEKSLLHVVLFICLFVWLISTQANTHLSLSLLPSCAQSGAVGTEEPLGNPAPSVPAAPCSPWQ